MVCLVVGLLPAHDLRSAQILLERPHKTRRAIGDITLLLGPRVLPTSNLAIRWLPRKQEPSPWRHLSPAHEANGKTQERRYTIISDSHRSICVEGCVFTLQAAHADYRLRALTERLVELPWSIPAVLSKRFWNSRMFLSCRGWQCPSFSTAL